MKPLLMCIILLLAGSPIICFNASNIPSDSILIIDHGQIIRVADEQVLTKIMEEASGNNLTVLTLAIAENEIREFQKQGIVIVKNYKEPKMLKVGGFIGVVPVNKICVIISGEDRYVMAYSSGNVSVMSLANEKAEAIKSLLKG